MVVTSNRDTFYAGQLFVEKPGSRQGASFVGNFVIVALNAFRGKSNGEQRGRQQVYFSPYYEKVRFGPQGYRFKGKIKTAGIFLPERPGQRKPISTSRRSRPLRATIILLLS
jgi:hypothetical protein